MKLKLNLSLAIALVSLAALPASAGALASRAQACPGAASEISPVTMGSVAPATLCLMNYERAVHRLPALRLNGALNSAAGSHARDMAVRNYFSHDTLGGGSFMSRIKAVRYLRPNTAWAVGENIGWGTGSMSTPAFMVASWMPCPLHRLNLLSRG
jgi:uncharacterized protein YkwD